jgi:hypothetical protein
LEYRANELLGNKAWLYQLKFSVWDTGQPNCSAIKLSFTNLNPRFTRTNKKTAGKPNKNKRENNETHYEIEELKDETRGRKKELNNELSPSSAQLSSL